MSGALWIPAKTKTRLYQSWRGIEAELGKGKTRKFLELLICHLNHHLWWVLHWVLRIYDNGGHCSLCPPGAWGLLGGRTVVIDMSGATERIPPEGQGRGEGPPLQPTEGCWRKGRVCGNKRPDSPLSDVPCTRRSGKGVSAMWMDTRISKASIWVRCLFKTQI